MNREEKIEVLKKHIGLKVEYKDDEGNVEIGYSTFRIGDVLSWIEENNLIGTFIGSVSIYDFMGMRKEKRKDISEQELDCIDFIYNLLTNNNTYE